MKSYKATPVWLSNDNIDEAGALEHDPVADMLSSSQSPVSGVVTEMHPETKTTVELQRIISRCKCQLSYVSYGDVNISQEQHFPPPVTSQTSVYLYTCINLDFWLVDSR